MGKGMSLATNEIWERFFSDEEKVLVEKTAPCEMREGIGHPVKSRQPVVWRKIS